MNETAADNEGLTPATDSGQKQSKLSMFTSSTRGSHSRTSQPLHPYNARPLSMKKSPLDEKGMAHKHDTI